MNIRQLEVFRAVMQTGTIKAAAIELGVTQPSVSNLLKHFESTLGFKLFSRHGNRVEATQEAQAMLGEIEPLFQLFKAVDQKIADIRDRETGRLRVAATPTCANSCVADAISNLFGGHRDTKVNLDVQRSEVVVEHVLHRIADVGISLSDMYPPSMEAVRLHNCHIVCALSAKHPLAAKPFVTPEDLEHETCISTDFSDGHIGKMITNAFLNAGIQPDWSFETPSHGTAIALVSRGVGCALVADDAMAMAMPATHSVVAVPFRPEISVMMHAVYLRERKGNWLIDEFISRLTHSGQVFDRCKH